MSRQLRSSPLTLCQTIRQSLARWRKLLNERQISVVVEMNHDVPLSSSQHRGVAGALAIVLADTVRRAESLNQIWVATFAGREHWEIEIADDDRQMIHVAADATNELAGPLDNALAPCGGEFKFCRCPEGGRALTISGIANSLSKRQSA